MFGDLIIWKEIIKYAKERKLEYLLFITDEKKEDWFILDKDKNNKGPRRELLNEIYYEVPTLKIFHITSSANFLKFSKKVSGIKIKDSSIEESEISFIEPFVAGSANITTFVPAIIDNTFRNCLPGFKLNEQLEPALSTNLFTATDYAINQLYARLPEKFEAILVEVFNFIKQINLDKNIFHKFVRLEGIINGYSFEFYY